MLKRYMHKRERHLAMLNDNRVVRPFEWGLEFIGEDADADDPQRLFSEFSKRVIENSEEYFAIPKHYDFTVRSLRGESVSSASADGSAPKNPPADADGTDKIAPPVLTWPSSVSTPSKEN